MKKTILKCIVAIVFLMAAGPLSSNAQTCQPAAPDLVSWWKGEGNALDIRGLHHGTLQGGTAFSTGRVGQSLSFDGADDAVLLGNQPTLQPASLTIEGWIYKDSLPAGDIQIILSKWGFDATVDSYLLGVTGDGGELRLFGAIGDGVTGDPGLSGGTISLGVWTHVAMTYNSADGMHRLFLNGAEVASRARPNGIFPTGSNVYIGRQDSSEQRFFAGSIDELSLYSRALSALEIQGVYNAGTAGKCNLSGRFSQKQKLTANPPLRNTGFGNSIAVSGETMVLGASGYDTTPNTGINIGAAYVFVRTGGVWTQQAMLQASDGASGDEFGYSVAISGETIVVGAFRSNSPASNSGAVYVFTRSGGVWTQQQKLTANDGAADDEFGNAVAISGDTIVAGSHSADQPSGGGHAGAVYIFNRSGTVWSQTQKLIPTGTILFGDFLGESVAISGDTIAAGASGDQEPTRTNRGSVYIYTRSGGSWSQQQKLIVPDTTPSTVFGASVAVDGNTVVAGALGDTPIAGQPNYGAAYVFARSGGGAWTQQQRLTASDGATSDYFGWSVAVRNSTIVVGARHDDTTTGPDAGSAYVFTSSGGSWTERQKLTQSDPAAGDRFGGSVALSSDGTLVIGAAEKNLPAGQGNFAGAAYVFNLGKSALFDYDGDGRSDVSIYRPSMGQWWLQQSSDNLVKASQFGTLGDKPVPGDYDGDGRTDIAVFRPSTGDWLILRSSNSSFYAIPFGTSNDVPAPGDFDGDSFADITVFRPSQGVWYISKSSGGTQITAWGAAGDVPVTGDYDGDGRADTAIFRPSNGQWWINRSTAGTIATTFGTGQDKAVAADYTGDGRVDIAFWRPADGFWFVLRSEDSSFFAVPFGASGDIPAAADYDGDGRADFAVFRPSSANWFINRSTGGVSIQTFGANGDLPTQASFIP